MSISYRIVKKMLHLTTICCRLILVIVMMMMIMIIIIITTITIKTKGKASHRIVLKINKLINKMGNIDDRNHFVSILKINGLARRPLIERYAKCGALFYSETI